MAQKRTEYTAPFVKRCMSFPFSSWSFLFERFMLQQYKTYKSSKEKILVLKLARVSTVYTTVAPYQEPVFLFSFFFFWIIFYELQVSFFNINYIYVWVWIVKVAAIGLLSAYALSLLPNNEVKFRVKRQVHVVRNQTGLQIFTIRLHS